MTSRTILLSVLLIATINGFSQTRPNSKKPAKTHFGIKGGVNFSEAKDATNLGSFKPKEGFMLGGFMAAGNYKSGMGFRTELLFTRQNLNVQNAGVNTATISSDYISIPHLTTFTFAHIVQLQAGGEMSILTNAKQDGGSGGKSIADFYSKLKYGITGGIEVRPFKGLIVGGRYTADVTNTYNVSGSSAMMVPYPFNLSTANLKGGLFQFSVGYIF